MEKKYTLNRLKTTNDIRPLVDQHWASLREAKAKGEMVAWASLQPLYLPLPWE